MVSLETNLQNNLTLLSSKKRCKGCGGIIYGPSDDGYHPASKDNPGGCRRFYLQED